MTVTLPAPLVPSPTDEALAATLRDRFPPRPRECWQNACAVASALLRKQHHPLLTAQQRASARYVEGWAVMPQHPVVFEHGWLEVEGNVVDVTLTTACPAYFPGVTYSLDEAAQAARNRRHLPIVAQQRPHAWGWGSRDYVLAYVSAHLYVAGETGPDDDARAHLAHVWHNALSIKSERLDALPPPR